MARARSAPMLDKDGDGAVTRAEAQSVPGGFARYFPEFDKDKDGFLTKEEFVKMGK